MVEKAGRRRTRTHRNRAIGSRHTGGGGIGGCARGWRIAPGRETFKHLGERRGWQANGQVDRFWDRAGDERGGVSQGGAVGVFGDHDGGGEQLGNVNVHGAGTVVQ